MITRDETIVSNRAEGSVLRTERQRQHRTLAQTGDEIRLSVSVLSRIEIAVGPSNTVQPAAPCAVRGVSPVHVATAQDEAVPLGYRWGDS
jgi:hypothetical protein